MNAFYFDHNDFYQKFRFIRNFKHSLFQECQLLKEKATNENVLLKEFDFFKFMEFNTFLLKLADNFSYNSCYNLGKLRFYSQKIVKPNQQWKIFLYYEYLDNDLERESLQKQKFNEIYPEELIWKLARDLINVLTFFFERDIRNIDLRLVNIYFVKIKNEIMFKLFNTSYMQGPIQMIKKGGISFSKFFLSPEVLELLSNSNYSFSNQIDDMKSNVFSLGLLLLYIGSLNATYEKFYFDNKMELNTENIRFRLNYIKRKYSDNFVLFLERLLIFEAKLRPTFDELTNYLNYFEQKTTKKGSFTENNNSSLKLSSIGRISSGFVDDDSFIELNTSENVQIEERITRLKSSFASRMSKIKSINIDNDKYSTIESINIIKSSAKKNDYLSYQLKNESKVLKNGAKSIVNQNDYASDNEYDPKTFSFSKKESVSNNIINDNVEKHIQNLKNSILYDENQMIKQGVQQVSYPDNSKYFGPFKNNMRTGKGIYYFKNGDCYIGEWKNNTIEGVGFYLFSNNEYYEGHFKTSRRNGSGAYFYANGDSYVGEWDMDKKKGFGRMVYNEIEDIYEGGWVKDLKEGEGIYEFKNGDKFIGEWKNGEKFGKGVVVFKNNSVFQGEWQKNLANGFGSLKFPNGDSYEGDYKLGAKQGSGIYKHNTGEKYAGDFLEDERTGRGVYYYPNGDKYIGCLKNGMREGLGEYFYENGDKYEGEWTNDKKEGQGLFIFFNGGKYEGEWKNNKMQGLGLMAYANDDVYEGEWLEGKKEGKGRYVWGEGGGYEGVWKNDLIVELGD